MKKTIAVCLIALTLIVPVFATGTVGISTGPAFSWLTVKEGSGDSTVSTKYSQIYYDVLVDAEYFFNDGPFGLAFGADISFPLSAKQGDTTVDLSSQDDPYFTTMFSPYIGATYLGKINRQFSWQAGAGMMVGFGSHKYSLSTGSTTLLTRTVRQTTIDIYADVAANYDFTKNIRASAGIKALIPVYTNFNYTYSSGSSSTESAAASNKTGFGILPYIGVSYIY